MILSKALNLVFYIRGDSKIDVVNWCFVVYAFYRSRPYFPLNL